MALLKGKHFRQHAFLNPSSLHAYVAGPAPFARLRKFLARVVGIFAEVGRRDERVHSVPIRESVSHYRFI